MKYKTLKEVKEAFNSGALSKERHALILDNDSVHIKTYGLDDDEDPPELFRAHHGWHSDIVCDALDMLGIPYDLA